MFVVKFLRSSVGLNQKVLKLKIRKMPNKLGKKRKEKIQSNENWIKAGKRRTIRRWREIARGPQEYTIYAPVRLYESKVMKCIDTKDQYFCKYREN
jgi:hypothetical protein